MKEKLTLLLIVSVSAALSCLAQTPEPPPSTDVSFEELPDLNASDILKPEVVKGPHHTVREPVSTFSGANQFMIDSEFGVFEADGNEMLLRRINEINAIARLNEVSRTDEVQGGIDEIGEGSSRGGQTYCQRSDGHARERAEGNHEIYESGGRIGQRTWQEK